MREPGWPFGNRPRAILLWELWKAGRIMSCEFNEHPRLGDSLRHRLRAIGCDCQYSRVASLRHLAEEEAENRHVVAARWTDRGAR